MTNTNDFRRYSYQRDTSYLISGFDMTRSSAAPKRITEQPEPEIRRGFKVRENVKIKSSEMIKAEEKLSTRRIVAIVALAILVIGFVCTTVYSFALKNELTRSIASIQTDISNAQSENISLRSQLDAMVSISMIDEYAVNELGMKKMKSNQIQYIDVEAYKQKRLSENAKSEKKAAKPAKQSNN